MISAVSVFAATRETTSDSANTVHMLEIVTSFFHRRPNSLISSRLSCSVRAMFSKKRKFVTFPFPSRQMTLES